MMYAILNEEKTHLHAIIRARLEQINSIMQKRKSLQALKEKLGWVLQMITKVSKDLETEENTVRQLKSSIKNLDRNITKVQNLSTHFPNVFIPSLLAAIRSAPIVVQV